MIVEMNLYEFELMNLYVFL